MTSLMSQLLSLLYRHHVSYTVIPIFCEAVIFAEILLVLGTWEEQLSEYVEKHQIRHILTLGRHVIEGGLKCRRHHGKMRLADINELDAVNVVLTTYHTVSAEWKAGNDAGRSILFSARWRRIILDEGEPQ